MGYLITGMDAGIGSPRAHQLDRMIRNPRYSLCQFRFHRTDAGFLQLPTMKASPIIFKREGDTPCSDGIIRSQLLGFEKQV